MFEKEFYVIVFDSTHYAIQTEKRLKEKFQIQTIPTPREITASCGLSIKFSVDQFDLMMDELNTNIESKFKVFKIEKKGSSKNVVKVM